MYACSHVLIDGAWSPVVMVVTTCVYHHGVPKKTFKIKTTVPSSCRSLLYGFHSQLARFFWERGGQGCAVALFAARLLERLASTRIITEVEQFINDRRAMFKLADDFERWSIGVLNECGEKDYFLALKVLKDELDFVRDLKGESVHVPSLPSPL